LNREAAEFGAAYGASTVIAAALVIATGYGLRALYLRAHRALTGGDR
jgi:hypothetical protein